MKIASVSRRSPRIEMIPLIDTFFLVLAFFISSVFSMQAARGLRVELPRAGAGQPIQRENRLTVTLGDAGELQWEAEAVTLEEMRRRLHAHPLRDSLQVGLRAEPATAYQRVVEVLGAVRESGVARVVLWTSPESKRRLIR